LTYTGKKSVNAGDTSIISAFEGIADESIVQYHDTKNMSTNINDILK